MLQTFSLASGTWDWLLKIALTSRDQAEEDSEYPATSGPFAASPTASFSSGPTFSLLVRLQKPFLLPFTTFARFTLSWGWLSQPHSCNDMGCLRLHCGTPEFVSRANYKRTVHLCLKSKYATVFCAQTDRTDRLCKDLRIAQPS